MFVLNRWCTSASADSTVSVREVGEDRRDLARRQHALVDQRSRRQADDVERLLRLGRELQRVDCVLDPLADHVELALEPHVGVVGGRRRPRPMKSWRKTGSAATALGPSAAVVGRHVAPAEDCCPSSPTIRSIVAVDRARARRRPSAGRRGRRRTPLGGGSAIRSRGRFLAEESIRHLDEDAGAVAGVGFAAAGAAVLAG